MRASGPHDETPQRVRTLVAQIATLVRLNVLAWVAVGLLAAQGNGLVMASRQQHIAFDTAHPAVPAAYVSLTLVLTMASMQPVLIVASLLGGFAFAVAVRGIRSSVAALRWQIPLVLVIAVLNPLFSASGSTEVMRLGLRAIYLESLCYGLAMGGLFVASAQWFQAATTMLPFDKVMALLGNRLPVVSLMVSQCMRLIPRFVRQGRLIAAVQDASAPSASVGEVSRARLRTTSVLMGWTMEDALETADAMRARGWGAAPRRTTYVRYRFTAADAAALGAIALGGALCLAISVTATGQYAFFPTMSKLVLWWGYAPYALWMLAPCALHIREVVRFA